MPLQSKIEQIMAHDWDVVFVRHTQNVAVHALENGKIVLFPKLPFVLSTAEKSLLTDTIASPKSKNISFNFHKNTLTGINASDEVKFQCQDMMSRFSNAATHLMQNLFPHYANALQIGRTSFRPVEIKGRQAPSYRKDDTRLHVDAFPSSPNQGKRILRLFTNINPEQSRVWHVGEPFEQVAKQFLPKVKKAWPGRGKILKMLNITRGLATDYDFTMLQLHNRMKADLNYQQKCDKTEIQFAPGNTWIVQTDHVSHAALVGQHVLEQTFYLPVESMVDEGLSPLRTLERLTGRSLI